MYNCMQREPVFFCCTPLIVATMLNGPPATRDFPNPHALRHYQFAPTYPLLWFAAVALMSLRFYSRGDFPLGLPPRAVGGGPNSADGGLAVLSLRDAASTDVTAATVTADGGLASRGAAMALPPPPPPPRSVPAPPRIAFMFLSRGAIPTEPLWRAFFDEARSLRALSRALLAPRARLLPPLRNLSAASGAVRAPPPSSSRGTRSRVVLLLPFLWSGGEKRLALASVARPPSHASAARRRCG